MYIYYYICISSKKKKNLTNPSPYPSIARGIKHYIQIMATPTSSTGAFTNTSTISVVQLTSYLE